jgi:DNA-binding IclR family transcriptional regulator
MRSVERTMSILEAVVEAESGIRLIDICEKVQLDASTVLRFLNSLVRLGYVSFKPDDKEYGPGAKLCLLGVGTNMLRRVSKAHMEALQSVTGEDVNLGVLDADHVICLETEKSSHILGVNFSAGLRMPAYASAMGKALLAFLQRNQRKQLLVGKSGSDELEGYTSTTITSFADLEKSLELVRQRGYSTDDQEYTQGVVCIGAPIFDAQNRAIGAISVTALSQRVSLRELEELYVEDLLKTCAGISRDLGQVHPTASG